MIVKGNKSKEPYADLGNLTQIDIAAYYLNIKSLPILIHSPLRKDIKPSFALYCINTNEVNYKDFSTKDSGNIWTLLKKLWKCSYEEAREKVAKDLIFNYNVNLKQSIRRNFYLHKNVDIQCKVRRWMDYDLNYWNSYGISLKWLKYANVYPISHKIIIKDNINYIYKADKYAYVYVEFKDNKTTLKIYQPYNKNGFKWSNKHDKSVISLWTKVPKKGNIICICSSLKDALCLWANTGIPSIAIQGEGYSMSNTAINELKSRFTNIYILLDNDKAGLEDGLKLSKETGFKNLVLPKINNAKDISDLYLSLNNKQQFKQILLKLFKNGSTKDCNCINQNTEEKCNHVRS